MGFKLNDQQQNAVLKALQWYYIESIDNPMFTLLGLAGVGKSTTINSIINTLGILKNSVLFCALTGKAASVIRLKGFVANTIHKSFYNAKVYKNNVYFTKKTSIPSFIKLIVIDEFGMVGDSIIEDILSFGIPVLAIGDPGQLAPLFEKNSFIDEELADVFLDKVMRTDDKSGILTIAMEYRNKRIIAPGIFNNSRVLMYKEEIKPLIDYDKILTWTNKTRRYLNKIIRRDLGITERYPIKGEKIVFLSNRYDVIINYMNIEIVSMNGIECIVIEDYKIENDDQIRLKARPSFMSENDEFFDILCSRKLFDSYEEELPDTKLLMQKDREDELNSIFCDFAYCITVNSSQGSEWQNCLVIDEMPKWRPEYFKWMYTAVTRASKSVDVLLNQ